MARAFGSVVYLQEKTGSAPSIRPEPPHSPAGRRLYRRLRHKSIDYGPERAQFSPNIGPSSCRYSGTDDHLGPARRLAARAAICSADSPHRRRRNPPESVELAQRGPDADPAVAAREPRRQPNVVRALYEPVSSHRNCPDGRPHLRGNRRGDRHRRERTRCAPCRPSRAVVLDPALCAVRRRDRYRTAADPLMLCDASGADRRDRTSPKMWSTCRNRRWRRRARWFRSRWKAWGRLASASWPWESDGLSPPGTLSGRERNAPSRAAGI